MVDGGDILDKTNTTFINDRFAKSNSAILFDSGRMKLMPKVYFQGDFTFMAWTKPTQLVWESILLDCTNGGGEKVHFSYYGYNIKGYFAIVNNYNDLYLDLVSNLQIGVWQHIAFGYQTNKAFLYYNGILEAEKVCSPVVPVNRTFCYIGGTSTRAAVDNIKIFDRALSSNEIYIEYYSQLTNQDFP